MHLQLANGLINNCEQRFNQSGLDKILASVVFVLQPVLIYPCPIFRDTLLNDR